MQTIKQTADRNLQKLLAAIDAGKPHKASHSTYQRGIEKGLIEWVPAKGPAVGCAGPWQEPHWRRTKSEFDVAYESYCKASGYKVIRGL